MGVVISTSLLFSSLDKENAESGLAVIPKPASVENFKKFLLVFWSGMMGRFE